MATLFHQNYQIILENNKTNLWNQKSANLRCMKLNRIRVEEIHNNCKNALLGKTRRVK